VILDFVAHGSHGLVEDRLHKRHAASASGAGFGARLDVADALACSVLGGIDHIVLRDIVARADLSVAGSI